MISNSIVRLTLAAVLLFGAISSFGGATMAIAFDGAGVPLSYLDGSPFKTFLIPGLVLGIVVGGTQLAAGVLLFSNRVSGLIVSAVAAFGMIIWIFVELAIISEYSWLQTVYLALGIIELGLILAILGIVPSLVPRWSHRERRSSERSSPKGTTAAADPVAEAMKENSHADRD